jgi:hypothetical protein
MSSQTTESGRRSGIWGKVTARQIAKAIGAKIKQADGRLQRSNFCLFRGKPAAIKTASLGNKTFLVYETLLQATRVTLFAAQSSSTNFKVYQIPSARIRRVGHPGFAPSLGSSIYDKRGRGERAWRFYQNSTSSAEYVGECPRQVE